MVNMIVLLSETVSRRGTVSSAVSSSKCKTMFLSGNWQHSGQHGPLFGFFNDNSSSVYVCSMFVCLFIYCVVSMDMEDTLGLLFSGLMSCQQYFSCINVTYHGIVLPMWSTRARENVPGSMAFLTITIAIALGINPGAPGWSILQWFQKISEILKWSVL